MTTPQHPEHGDDPGEARPDSSGTEWSTPAPQESGLPAYNQQSYQEYGAPPERSGTQVYSIIAFVCAAISLLFCPILFGPAGIVLGLVGRSKGERLGKVAAIVAAVAFVAGIVVSYVVLAGDVIPDES
ncbi:hypothetical protein ACLMAJ_02255 [Nocardia sp. KC 131]|uniref:hypothetical protein n=1 Tax=Nocardia arseniciresistens TaxID=3392119 RepID=UPI00398E98ED